MHTTFRIPSIIYWLIKNQDEMLFISKKFKIVGFIRLIGIVLPKLSVILVEGIAVIHLQTKIIYISFINKIQLHRKIYLKYRLKGGKL